MPWARAPKTAPRARPPKTIPRVRPPESGRPESGRAESGSAESGSATWRTLRSRAGAARRAQGRAGKWPGTVVAWLTTRKAARSGVIWGYIFGVAIASSAVSYTRIYKTPAQREALAAAYGANKATSALFGPAPQLQTVAGFTVFKISMTLMILGAVWGLLTSAGLLRGEEDNGRWELLLAGQTTRSGAAAQALGGLGAGVVTLWAVTGLITALTGLYSSVGIAAGPALYFALAMVAAAVMFLAVGALTSQLAATRRQAASYAASFLGVSYAVRMIADAEVGLRADLGVSARLGGGTPASFPRPSRWPCSRSPPSPRWWPPPPCAWPVPATPGRASCRTGTAAVRICGCSPGPRALPPGCCGPW